MKRYLDRFLSGPTDVPSDLDESSQRRVILQAVKDVAPDSLGEFRKEQPTVAVLEQAITSDLWVTIGFLWFPIISAFGIADMVPKWRVRRAVRDCWGRYLSQPDAECALWVLEGDIRRTLRALPRSQRRQAKDVARELARVCKHFAAFHTKLEIVRRTLAATAGTRLQDRHTELVARLAAEKDALTLASLERQLGAVQGQLEAHDGLIAWQGRLEAALDECRDCLEHLRSRLALAAATGTALGAGSVSDVTAQLTHLNRHLADAQVAAEEVLQLGS